MDDLTICSVYHNEETKRLLELNEQLVRQMNPGVRITWLVSDGSQPGTPPLDPSRFTTVPGFRPDNAPALIADRPDFKMFTNSYLHGASLNDLLSHVKTRFAVLLDNDFFIVRPEWMREVVAHMRGHNLSFFGSPFHPRRFDKYRYFPCQQCFFVDLSRVDYRTLDFIGPHGETLTLADKVARKIFHLFDPKRFRIGRSRDTSVAVFDRYGHDRTHRRETVQPVFDPAFDFSDASRFTAPAFAASRANQVLEWFLPDRFCYTPKRRGYVSHTGFREAGYPDVRAVAGGNVNSLAWEEYMWQGVPFGVHMQGVSKRFRRGQIDLKETFASLEKAVNSYAK